MYPAFSCYLKGLAWNKKTSQQPYLKKKEIRHPYLEQIDSSIRKVKEVLNKISDTKTREQGLKLLDTMDENDKKCCLFRIGEVFVDKVMDDKDNAFYIYDNINKNIVNNQLYCYFFTEGIKKVL